MHLLADALLLATVHLIIQSRQTAGTIERAGAVVGGEQRRLLREDRCLGEQLIRLDAAGIGPNS